MADKRNPDGFLFPDDLSEDITGLLLQSLSEKAKGGEQRPLNYRRIHDCISFYYKRPMVFGLVDPKELTDKIVVIE